MTDTPETTPDNPHYASVIAQYATVMCDSTNIDGWTGERQRRFLEFIAEGDTVRGACKAVKLSTASAYAFRRRAKGRAFDLGWKAADLIAREKVAGDLLGRAMDGQVVEITRADGSTVTKHHYDNRLALTMLARLDRYADAAENTAPGHSARLVAGDFDAYLEMIGAEGGPARAGLFMLARGADAANTPAAELEPIVALARADRHLRCGTLAPDVDTADLDPGRRADWTAEQWLRAEAAGVMVLAPPPAPEQPASECQPVSTSPEPEPDDEPVWWEDYANDGKGGWRTHFPPPELFLGREFGDYGDDYYTRELDEDELALVDAIVDPELEARRAEESEERDRWFAALRDPDKPLKEKLTTEERLAKLDAMLKTAGPQGGATTPDGELDAADDEQEEEEEEYEPHVLDMIARGDAMLRARFPDPERPADPPVEVAPSSDQGASHGLQEA